MSIPLPAFSRRSISATSLWRSLICRFFQKLAGRVRERLPRFVARPFRFDFRPRLVEQPRAMAYPTRFAARGRPSRVMRRETRLLAHLLWQRWTFLQ